MNAIAPGHGLALIRRTLTDAIGLDPESIGPGGIRQAIAARIAESKSEGEAAYASLVSGSEAERDALVERVVVPESWFFRDGLPFEQLRDTIARPWATDPKRPPLRVLSLPCAGGEEPYSIALTLLEAGLASARFCIDAIDVSNRQLDRARRGIYRASSFRGGNLSDRDRWFEPTSEGYRINVSLRDSVRWERGNILDPGLRDRPPFDVVFCRNLLIYLTEEARRRSVETLERLVRPGGLLFVGHAEAPLVPASRFEAEGRSGAFAFRRRSAEESPGRSRSSDGSGVRVSEIPAMPPPSRRSASTEAPAGPIGLVSPDEVADLANRREWDQAITLAALLVQERPSDPTAHLLLGSIAQAIGRPDEAERSFRRAVYLDIRCDEALLALAALAADRGDHLTASNYRRRASLAAQGGGGT